MLDARASLWMNKHFMPFHFFPFFSSLCARYVWSSSRRSLNVCLCSFRSNRKNKKVGSARQRRRAIYTIIIPNLEVSRLERLGIYVQTGDGPLQQLPPEVPTELQQDRHGRGSKKKFRYLQYLVVPLNGNNQTKNTERPHIS